MEKKDIMNRIRNAAGLCLVLALLTGLAHDASAQELMVLDLQTAMQIALTQSNDIIRQQNSYERGMLSIELLKANQKTRTTLSWSLPSYNKSITPVSTPTGDVYTNRQTFNTSAQLNITQPVRWLNGTFSFSTDYRASNQYILDKFGNINPNHNWTDAFNLSYNQPLFQPNTQKYTWERTHRNFEIETLEYEQTENRIWSTVLRDFYNLYQAKRSLEIQQDNFENTEKNYDMAVNKYNAGILALVDKYQWESQLRSTENQLSTRELNFKRQKDRFKRSIGLPIDQEIDVVAEIEVKFIEIDEQKAFDEAFARSVSLKSASYGIIDQKHSIRVQEAEDRISASLRMSYGLNESNEFGEFWNSGFYNQGGEYSYENWTNNLFNDFDQSNSVSLSLNIPVWDSGRRRLKLQSSMLSLDQSERNIINSEDQLRVDIQNYLDAVQNARDRISILGDQIRIAELEYDINKQKFDLGEINNDQLTNSNNRLTNAKEDVLGAQISYLLALATLYNQTFWDFENNCPLNETVGKFIER